MLVVALTFAPELVALGVIGWPVGAICLASGDAPAPPVEVVKVKQLAEFAEQDHGVAPVVHHV